MSLSRGIITRDDNQGKHLLDNTYYKMVRNFPVMNAVFCNGVLLIFLLHSSFKYIFKITQI